MTASPASVLVGSRIQLSRVRHAPTKAWGALHMAGAGLRASGIAATDGTTVGALSHRHEADGLGTCLPKTGTRAHSPTEAACRSIVQIT